MRAVQKLPVSPWPHTIGFALAIVGCIVIVARFYAQRTNLAVMSVYACGLLAAFGSSALYHWLGGRGPGPYAVFKRLDHAAIYLLIGGSYTPVLYFGLAGMWRTATLSAVWLLTIVGIVSTFWFAHAPRALSTALYATLGWLAIIPAAKLCASLAPTAIVLILAGGVLYTIGGIIYATRSFDFVPGRFGFHEIFHLFVLAGAAVHFAAIGFTLTRS